MVGRGVSFLFKPRPEQACSFRETKKFSRGESGGACLASDGLGVDRTFLEPGLNPLGKEPGQMFSQAGAERQVDMRRGVLGELDLKRL